MASNNSPSSLVSSRLNGNNYVAWSRAMRIALGGKDLLSHVDGTTQPPPIPPKPAATATAEIDVWEASCSAAREWQRRDFQVMTYILNSIETTLSETFVYAENARDLWDDVDRRFGASVEPQVFHLRGELQALRQDGKPVIDYFTKLKHIWNQLDTLRPLPTVAGEVGRQLRESRDAERLQQFLFGLDDSYDSLANQIVASKPPLSLDEAYRMVLTSERR
ncbi:hypothetical protein M569_16198, partial [Genlisea aurea]